MATRGMLISLTLLVSIGTSMVSLEAAALTYHITDIGSLNGGYSGGNSVNNSGQVTGVSGTQYGFHAILYDAGTLIDLGSPGGQGTVGQAINEFGQITGVEFYPHFPSSRIGFVFDGTTMTELGTLGGPDSHGLDINDSGQITGFSSIDVDGQIERAFLYENGSMTDLGTLGGQKSSGDGINESGQVTGSSATADDEYHAFFYDGVTMHDLGTLGGERSWGNDINDAGQIIGGSYTDQTTNSHAFLYDGGALVDLGTLGGPGSDAFAINNHGRIVGSASVSAFEQHAYLYDARLGGMVDLNDYIDNPSQWTLEAAYDISDTGYITGVGLYNGQARGFILTPIPEPTSFSLLGLGVAGLALRFLQRKRTER